MEFTGGDLRAWYGTSDAPAPSGCVAAGQAVFVTVGVEPSHPSNRVDVLYRVRDRWDQMIHATLVQPAAASPKQYFKATFPVFTPGDVVEYQPVIHCAGRRLTTPQPFPSCFNIGDAPLPANADPSVQPSTSGSHRYGFRMEHLTCIRLQLASVPEVIGNTPDGLRIDFYITGGRAAGEKINGVYGPHGGDWMRIRTDGVGVTDIFATLETQDGAMILVEASGTADFGMDGFQNALAGKFPDFADLVLTPRFLSSDSRYAWLNRLQCLGIGRADLRALEVHYDLYAMHQTKDGNGGGTAWQRP